MKEDLWRGLSPDVRKQLATRDYSSGSLGKAVAGAGVEARQLIAVDRSSVEAKEFWIPGVEIFSRTIYPQRHRGSFGEFARRGEGVLGRIGLWPRQWAAARMFAQTAKGFHIHPPHIPPEVTPADWLKKLFIDTSEDYASRRYEEEQWDVMFFVQGVAEMILHDSRAGLQPRTMRFIIDGDNHRSQNNVAVLIPPGVAHAIRAEGSEDLIMVYGTSTSFEPDFEGRIAANVETAPLPASWQRFLAE